MGGGEVRLFRTIGRQEAGTVTHTHASHEKVPKGWSIFVYGFLNYLGIRKGIGVGGVRKFLSLKELRNAYPKMDQP